MFTQKDFDNFVGKILNLTTGFHSNKQRFPNDVTLLKNSSYENFSNNSLENPSTFPKYINLSCEFMHQERANKCVDSCVRMLASYHLKKIKNIPHILITKMKPLQKLLDDGNQRYLYQGMDTYELSKLLDGKLFKTISISSKILMAKSFQTNYLGYILYHFGPVIVFMNFQSFFGHAVLLKGVNENTVLIHDPWFGADQHYNINTFNKYIDFTDPGFIYFRDLNKLDEFYERNIVAKLI